MIYNEGAEPEGEVRRVLMSWIQLRENRERVLEAVSGGHANEVAMCQAAAFDELAAAMHAPGCWEQLEATEADLHKAEHDSRMTCCCVIWRFCRCCGYPIPVRLRFAFSRTMACCAPSVSRSLRIGMGSTIEGGAVLHACP
jgi:hypothetical protein